VSRAIQNSHVTIVDARSADEYAGRKSDASRAGHIPAAISIASTSHLMKEGSVCRIDDLERLRSLYAGVPADRKIITYCNTGQRASVGYLALRALGRDVAVYDGSWMEWGNDPSLPIEADPSAAAGE
jgi:thiosulfate/3-mercaptopyruvate sulfurtransferase